MIYIVWPSTINLPCFPYLILSEKSYYSFSSLPIFWTPPPSYIHLSLQWLPVQYKSKSFQPEMDQTITVHLTGSCTVKTCSSHLAFMQICLGSNKDSSSETYHRCMLLSKLGLNRMKSITSFLALFRKVSSLPLIPVYSPQDTIYTFIVGITVFPTQLMDISVTSKNHTGLFAVVQTR